MANKLGPIEVQCDAPPYSIVQACSTVGFKNPEDVRWWRKSRFQVERPAERQTLAQHLWGCSPPVESDGEHCTCGEKLPALQGYTFTFTTGEEASYNLGQCPRCRTVFWDEI